MGAMFQHAWGLFERGGVVMWPLLLISVVSLAMSLERAVFWARTHTRARLGRVRRLSRALLERDLTRAQDLARRDRSIYGSFVRELVSASRQPTPAGVHELIESLRPVIERFGPSLSAIVTAAPMLGILGTVLGIIRSFGILGDAAALRDPSLVAGGIAEALFTTVAGLVIALATLFPLAIFRSQADRALARLELLAAAVLERRGAPNTGDQTG